MGASINAVPLPAEIQRMLPPGVLVNSFDGEVDFRHKSDSGDFRSFSLIPVTDDDSMYERRWTFGSVQETTLAIENFQSHIVTVYYLYVPTDKTSQTGIYVIKSFAAFSWGTRQWVWVRHPLAIRTIFEGHIGQTSAAAFKASFKMIGKYGLSARQKTDDDYVAAIDAIVTYIRRQMDLKLKQADATATRL